jgi:hypothetical protein
VTTFRLLIQQANGDRCLSYVVRSSDAEGGRRSPTIPLLDQRASARTPMNALLVRNLPQLNAKSASES